MGVYAFNSSNIQSWPIPGFTTKWFSAAWNDQEVRDALWLSLRAGLFATGLALVLGSLASFGLSRSRFFGRDSISFLFVLPIALPGIITGLALNSFFVIWGVSFSLWTIVIGHATFCVVVVYNNVIARLRRTSGSFFEASADLGATGFQTFRYVTLPMIGTALIAGALLAFALSWDEIVVTYFTAGAQNTLPLLDLRLHPPGPEPADRECDRARRDRRQSDPGRTRAAADERPRRGPRLGALRARETPSGERTLTQAARLYLRCVDPQVPGPWRRYPFAVAGPWAVGMYVTMFVGGVVDVAFASRTNGQLALGISASAWCVLQGARRLFARRREP